MGPPAWVRACFNSPEWGGGSSPVKTEASPDCIIVVVVIVVGCWLLLLLLFGTLLDDCVWSHDIGDAMSPRTNLHVAGHLGVRLPATPLLQGALDDEELFIVEGSKNPRLNPFRVSPKNGPSPSLSSVDD